MLTRLTATALLCTVASFAHADPFAAGDAKIGKQMIDKHCISCHASSFGGGWLRYLHP